MLRHVDCRLGSYGVHSIGNRQGCGRKNGPAARRWGGGGVRCLTGRGLAKLGFGRSPVPSALCDAAEPNEGDRRWPGRARPNRLRTFSCGSTTCSARRTQAEFWPVPPSDLVAHVSDTLPRPTPNAFRELASQSCTQIAPLKVGGAARERPQVPRERSFGIWLRNRRSALGFGAGLATDAASYERAGEGLL